jgi:KduI/IolB family
VPQMTHPAAPPNHLALDELRVRPGPDGVSLAIDPARADWRYLTFKAVAVGAGERLAVGSVGAETVLVVLAGGGLILEPESGPALNLEGRRSVFHAKPWAAYLPAGHVGQLTARPLDNGRVLVAMAQAPSSGQAGAASSPILIRPDDVKVEVRGAGNATRRIHHIIAPDFPADRLEVVEVYTPAGNWSSWPRTSTTWTTCRMKRSWRRSTTTNNGGQKAGPCNGSIGATATHVPLRSTGQAHATASGPSVTVSWSWSPTAITRSSPLTGTTRTT